MTAAHANESVRYEPDEIPPPAIAIGSGLQAAMLIVAPVVLTVIIVFRIAEQPKDYLSWGIFAALIISGITTVLQAVRVGRVGAGHVLIMGTSGAFIAVCVAALTKSSPATMASLIIISSLFQFLLAAKLSLLRRIFTPIVSGTVIMLIAVTVMPIIFDSLTDVPEGVSSAAAPIAAFVTLATVIVLVLRAPASWRLWSPIIGIGAGCIVSIPFGIYDAQQILDASWIGVPFKSWPGIDVSPGVEFWALLPAFIVVTIVGAIETIGDGVAIQRVSNRQQKATDFRVVQGALNADGVGNLLSGLMGTLPNTTYSTSISLAEVTGIAARRVGIIIGIFFLILAFFPKFAAALIAIPSPVAAAYITVLIGLLFVQGMKIIIQDGMDHRKAAVVGLAFWAGVGFQNKWIFPDLLGDGFLGVLLGNGMTSGAIVAIIMMAFLEVTALRRKRLDVPFNSEALPQMREFLQEFASRAGWSASEQDRLLLVGEETLTNLIAEGAEDSEGSDPRRLLLSARSGIGSIELEFVSASEGENIEDQLSYLGEKPDIQDDRDISFRLLRHYASSVRHQKYHGIDIVTVSVEPTR